jgi:hypothetical protein
MSKRHIKRLHARDEIEGYPYECVNGDCEHSNIPNTTDECPLVKIAVCGHCARLASPGESFDDLVPDEVIWPCETRKALAL